MWAEISCWAGAARKETGRGAALGTRWGWPAIALSASAPNATRTGTATPVVATTAALASASAAAAAQAAAIGDEQMDDGSLSQLCYSLCNLSLQKYVIVLLYFML